MTLTYVTHFARFNKIAVLGYLQQLTNHVFSNESDFPKFAGNS